MTRVKGGAVAKNRRRKVLKNAKGYFGSKHRLYKTAQEQLFHSGAENVFLMLHVAKVTEVIYWQRQPEK